MTKPDDGAIQHVVDSIWQLVLDTYCDNLYTTEDGTNVYETHWEKELRASIVKVLADERLACQGAEWEALRQENARLGRHVADLQAIMARSGEQPLPVPGQADVTPVAKRLFLETLAVQQAKGTAKYGTTLQTLNGRDALRDALAELVDAMQYVVQAMMVRDMAKEASGHG